MREQEQSKYEAPSVIDLGSLAELTMTLANKSATLDGGMGSTDKTA